MDLYFKRHDGQAVTCEDFFAAMRDANDADFANFLLWYITNSLFICVPWLKLSYWSPGADITSLWPDFRE